MGMAYSKNNPQREISVIFNGSYMPNQIVAFEGEDLTVHYANLSFDPTCLFSGDLKLFISSYQFNVSSVRLQKLSRGTYSLRCPGVSYQGKGPSLKVLPRPEEVIAEKTVSQRGRAPASVSHEKVYDKSVKEWVPRDENEAELFYHGDL